MKSNEAWLGNVSPENWSGIDKLADEETNGKHNGTPSQFKTIGNKKKRKKRRLLTSVQNFNIG